MGLCFSKKSALVKKQSSPSLTQPGSSSNSGDGEVVGGNNNNGNNIWGNSRLSRREEARIHEKALATALLLQKQLRSGSVGGGGGGTFDRSASVRNNYGNSKKNQNLPRTTSSRPRSLTDPPVQPQQLVNEKLDVDDIETAHFVLVHGGGFGAWCWYKSIALLQDTGYKVTAIDLIGSGIDSLDTNSVTSLAQYVKPLTDFLANLADDDKVILVGHDFGGACISYAMELFPSRISKAVFVAATMLTSGQSALDMFSQQEERNDLMQQAQIFLYAKGNDNPPTAIDLNKTHLKDLFFNNSPTKDVALASVSMRPIPFPPLLEKLSLSDTKYGSVRRFYIQTSEDNAIPFSLQQSMISAGQPPEQVFCVKGADHSPFFSKPQALHKLLAEISKIP